MDRQYTLSVQIKAQADQAQRVVDQMQARLTRLSTQANASAFRMREASASAAGFGRVLPRAAGPSARAHTSALSSPGGAAEDAGLKSVFGLAGRSTLGMLTKTRSLGMLGGLSSGAAGGALRVLSGGLSKIGPAAAIAGAALGRLWDIGKTTFGYLSTAVGAVARGFGTVLSGAVGIARHALLGLGIAAGTATAVVWGALKALSPAGQMQAFEASLTVMLKSADKARERLAYLSDFARRTPFELPQVVEAANLMQTFGIYSKRNLTAAGDAAAAFNKPLEEVVRSVNYLAGGRTGEAFESLARIGITRDKLKPLGVTFAKSGELTSSPKAAFAAVMRYMELSFGGMSAKMSKTWFGVLSNMKDAWFRAWAGFGGGLLKYATPAVETLSKLVDTIGKRLEGFDWGGIGTGLLTGVKTAAKLVDDLFSPKSRGMLLQIGGDFLKTLPGLFTGLASGLVKDLGATAEALFSNLGGVFTWAWDGLRLAFRYGTSLFGEMLSGMSREFGDRIMLALPGNSQRKQELGQADRAAVALAMNTVADRAGLSTYARFNLGSYARTSRDEAGRSTMTADDARKAFVKIGRPELGSDFTQEWSRRYRKYAGYDRYDGTEAPLGGFRAEADSLKAWTARGFRGAKFGLSTANTNAALQNWLGMTETQAPLQELRNRWGAGGQEAARETTPRYVRMQRERVSNTGQRSAYGPVREVPADQAARMPGWHKVGDVGMAGDKALAERDRVAGLRARIGAITGTIGAGRITGMDNVHGIRREPLAGDRLAALQSQRADLVAQLGAKPTTDTATSGQATTQAASPAIAGDNIRRTAENTTTMDAKLAGMRDDLRAINRTLQPIAAFLAAPGG